MTANQAMEYLLKVADKRDDGIITGDTLAVVVARAGALKPLVMAGKIKNLINEDFGGPLHSLIIPSKLHFIEAEALVELAGAPESILELI
jgi:diphthine synthase